MKKLFSLNFPYKLWILLRTYINDQYWKFTADLYIARVLESYHLKSLKMGVLKKKQKENVIILCFTFYSKESFLSISVTSLLIEC